MTDVATHAEGCWEWGQKHHACAVREIERLRARVAELGRDLDACRVEILEEQPTAGEGWFSGVEPLSDERTQFVANALELRAFMLLDGDDAEALRHAAGQAFQVARSLPRGSVPLDAAAALVRVSCLGVLGGRGADVRRLLLDDGLPVLPVDASDWGTRVSASILDMWLRLFRKQGWEDLDAVQQRAASLRADQREYEPTFLARAEERKDARPAWELMSQYHLAKAAEILGNYLSHGSIEGHYDIREQLEPQFDFAIAAASRGQLMEQEVLARLLARTARVLVDNSIWTVTR